MTLALISAYKKAQKQAADSVVDKWQLYKNLCEAKKVFKISDRSLAVLNALLSFYPETELKQTAKTLVVFPSNNQLSLRAHGMPAATLRRHLAILVDAGLIQRRDSPNGKRYAYKSKTGQVEEAFGFSLLPLLVRSDEIAQAAETERAAIALLRRTREQISLQRRDIAKILEAAMLETHENQTLQTIHNEFRTLVDALPRRATQAQLDQIFTEISNLRLKLDNYLDSLNKTQNMSANDTHNERQYIESESESHINRALNSKPASQRVNPINKNILDLDFVLRACPEFNDYALQPIKHWQQFIDLANQIKSYIGIQKLTFHRANQVFGFDQSAILIACLLQKGKQVQSADAYLHSLTEKAKNSAFCVYEFLKAEFKRQQRLSSNLSQDSSSQQNYVQ